MKNKKRGNYIKKRYVIQLISIYFESCQRYFLFFSFHKNWDIFFQNIRNNAKKLINRFASFIFAFYFNKNLFHITYLFYIFILGSNISYYVVFVIYPQNLK